MALRAFVVWGVVALLWGVACGGSHDTAPRQLAGAGGECAECGGEPSGAVAGQAGAAEGGVFFASPGGAGGEAGASLGEGGQAGEAPVAAPPDVALRAVTITQTLEIPLVAEGAAVPLASRPVPLLAGKRALVRAFVGAVPPFRARPLLGVLDLDTGLTTRSLVSEREISASSTQEDLGSSFVFEVPADDLTPESRFRLRVLEADTTPVARFPETGFVELEARRAAPFQLVLVPFVVSGFAPKLGENELTSLRRRLVALLPSVGVDITVEAPVTLSYVVDAEGAGWDEALDEIYELRAKARPAHDVFFFGLMAPGPSFDAYCPDGCTVGYSVVADASDVDFRGSIGVGVFPDGSGSDDAWDTLAHELGHALGREHAPCPAPPSPDRPDNIDPRWPSDARHASGAIGAYGYDFDTSRLVKPGQVKDVMSYCTPIWVSDYTYAALLKRLDYIQNERFRLLESTPAEPFRLARIGRGGQARWLTDRVRHGSAEASPVALLDASGRSVKTVQAQVVRLDHAPGAYVWLPARELGAGSAVSVDLRPLGGGVLAL